MQQSTNYNFNLPEGTDLVNLLTQLIPNWNSLDTILKGVQDSTFQNATETVSLGVHAITRLNPDAKLLKWIATANFEAGDTFTIDGIATPASLPSGEALGEDAYIAGSVVIAALNADESALTVYVTTGTIAVAADSERLGGQLPAYYSTKAYADAIKSTADAASDLITKKALVNTYYNSSDKKLYQVNADGTVGGEISMSMPILDFASPLFTFSASNLQYTATKECYICGTFGRDSGTTMPILTVNGSQIAKTSGNAEVFIFVKIKAGDAVVYSPTFGATTALGIYDTV